MSNDTTDEQPTAVLHVYKNNTSSRVLCRECSLSTIVGGSPWIRGNPTPAPTASCYNCGCANGDPVEHANSREGEKARKFAKRYGVTSERFAELCQESMQAQAADAARMLLRCDGQLRDFVRWRTKDKDRARAIGERVLALLDK